VRLTKVGTPVTTTDGQNAELGNDDGSADGGSDFLGGLDTETDVTLAVTNDDNGLETGTLTGTSLLLDGLDLFSRRSLLAQSVRLLYSRPPDSVKPPQIVVFHANASALRSPSRKKKTKVAVPS
jgi:hypothetical protein